MTVFNVYTNQFGQSVVPGDLDLNIMKSGTITGILSLSNGGNAVAGSPMKIDTTITSGKVISFLQATQSQLFVGFLQRLSQKATFAIGDAIQVAIPALPVMWLLAAGTITPGASVESDSTGLLVETLASGKLRGIALDYMTVGTVGRVLITGPLGLAS